MDFRQIGKVERKKTFWRRLKFSLADAVIVVDTYKQAAAKFESNDEYLKREVDEIVFERLRSRPHLPVAT